jgi:hypothetical protein
LANQESDVPHPSSVWFCTAGLTIAVYWALAGKIAQATDMPIPKINFVMFGSLSLNEIHCLNLRTAYSLLPLEMPCKLNRGCGPSILLRPCEGREYIE